MTDDQDDSRLRYRALRAVTAALYEQDKALLIKRCLRANPNLRGANADDLIDMASNADACIRQTEPAFERYGKRLIAGLQDYAYGITLEEPFASYIIYYVLYAVALMYDGEPNEYRVWSLATHAAMELP